MTEQATAIDGLVVKYDFISADEEAAVIEAIQKGQPKGNFRDQNIPDYLLLLAKKLVEEKHLSAIPSGISVDVYEKGECILPRIENRGSGTTITILSLSGEVDFELTNGNEKFVIPMPPRTLIQMFGDIRWNWRYAMPPVSSRTYLIMFRRSS